MTKAKTDGAESCAARMIARRERICNECRHEFIHRPTGRVIPCPKCGHDKTYLRAEWIAAQGHETHKGRELSARLQDDEDDASLDCGCVLTRDDDGDGAALFKCATCEAAPDLLAAVELFARRQELGAALADMPPSKFWTLADKKKRSDLLAEYERVRIAGIEANAAALARAKGAR